VRHPVEQRKKASALHAFAGGKRQRPHGTAMEGAVKADELRAFGVGAGQLDGRLYGLGAGVSQEAASIFRERGDLVQLLGQLHHQGVVEVRGDVDEFRRLCLNRLHHLRMGVAGGTHRDTGGPVDVAVAIHVPHLSAATMVHHERILAGIRWRNPRGIPRQDFLRLRTGYISRVDGHKTMPLQT